MTNAVLFLFILFSIYTVIPFILSRLIGMGVLKKGGQEAIQKRQIALTFDDGPNPKYTNDLLDLLKQYNIKASFFVVGANAEKYPDIIARIHQEGHLIGIHNYVHHSNWFMSPWKVKRGIEASSRALETITKSKPVYYRPPWGMLNLCDYFIHPDYQTIFWSLMAGDWRSRGGSQRIRDRLLNGVKPGDVILLHDSGENWGADEDAPYHTIEALKFVLKELTDRGYHFVRVDDIF